MSMSKTKNRPSKTKVKKLTKGKVEEVLQPEMLEPFSSMIHPDNHKALKLYAANQDKKIYEALHDALNMGLFELNNR